MKLRSVLSLAALAACLTGLSWAQEDETTVPEASAGQAAVKQVKSIWIGVPSTAAALQSITAKAPGAGYMLVTVTGTLSYNHVSGTEGSYCLALSQTSKNVGACVPDASTYLAIRGFVPATDPSSVTGFGTSVPYSIVGLYPVTSDTTYTFYLNGYVGGMVKVNGSPSWLFQPTITVLFVPAAL